MIALLLSFTSILAQSLNSVAPNGSFMSDGIEYWVGEGENEIGLILYYNNSVADNDCFVLGYRFSGSNTSLEDALTEISTTDQRFQKNGTGFLNDFAFDYNEDGVYEFSSSSPDCDKGLAIQLLKNCSFTSGMNSEILQGDNWYSVEYNGFNGTCWAQVSEYAPVPTLGGGNNSCDITSLPYTEGFDTYGVSSSGNYTFPTCWTKITTGNTPNISSSKHSGLGGLYMQVANNAQVVAVFPKLSDDINLNSLVMTFWGKVNSIDKRIVLGVMTDKDDISTFDTVFALNPSTTSWQEYTADFTQYENTGKYIAFMAKGWEDVGNAYYIDDIELYADTLASLPSMTDENIIAWAKGMEVTRADSITTGNYYDAIGQANTTNFVAIYRGMATATFDRPIKNGTGADFVIFANENGNNGQAYVEVSSDGENFFRFANKTSVLSTGYGTAYDLSDIEDNTNLDKNNIRLIRLTDDSLGGFNLAGIGIYNGGEQYLIADFENMLSSANSYEIVTSTTGTLIGQDEFGMSMYSQNYNNGGLVFNGLGLYDGAFSIGWGPSNLTTSSGYYASSSGAAIEGAGNGYLQGYYSDYTGTTEHLTVVTQDSTTFYPQGTYIS